MAETKQLTHLDWIQRQIERYSRQALAMKAIAMLLTTAMLVTIAMVDDTGAFVSAYDWSATAAVVLLFVLWTTDAHYHQRQRLFTALYDDVRRNGGDTDLNMSVEPYRTGNRFTQVLWERPMALIYIGAITALALPLVFN